MVGADMRKYPRNNLKTKVMVNDGIPYTGGKLLDMSISGAAVIYLEKEIPQSEPITVGQVLVLNFKGTGTMPARVARTFDGGFAAEFDFSVSVK